MKKLTFLFLSIFIHIQIFSQATASRLDSLLHAFSTQNNFNGSVLVAQKGKIILEKGYGFKNKMGNSLNSVNTIFQIGSITKQFTAAIVLQLVKAGKMTLQDKLSKYFPGYPQGDFIRIEQLLTHTAGIYNYTNDEVFMTTRSEQPIARDSLLALFEFKPLDFSPGSKWNYSNSGYILLGMIIEKVTGQSYFKTVREKIFDPLGMRHSGFDFTDLNTSDKAQGYTGDFARPAGIVDSTVSFSAGSIYTTIGDLYKWDRALYTNQVVDQALLQKGFTPFQSSYGYGWQIGSAYGKKTIQHGGGITGFLSYILRVPQDQLCIIVLSNLTSLPPEKIAVDINGIFNGKIPGQEVFRKEIKVDSGKLLSYVGDYELMPSFHILVTLENGQLQARATGQGKNPLYAERYNFFFLKGVDAQLEFFAGSDGKTDHLVLYQNGQKITGKKVNPFVPISASPAARKEITVDSNTLALYVGEYALAPSFHILITLENGLLRAQATGQTKNTLYAERPNFFFLEIVDAQLEFIPGPDGKTDHLILYQDGQKVEGKKIR